LSVKIIFTKFFTGFVETFVGGETVLFVSRRTSGGGALYPCAHHSDWFARPEYFLDRPCVVMLPKTVCQGLLHIAKIRSCPFIAREIAKWGKVVKEANIKWE